MKDHNMSSCIWHILITVVLLSPNVTLNAANNQDPREILRLVQESHRENLKHIRTWKGKSAITHQIDADNGNSLIIKANATFAIDRDKDANRWNVKVHTQEEKVGEHIEVTPPYLQANMLKGDKYYDYFPGAKNLKGQTVNTLVIWPKERYNNKTRHVAQFNAMDYLNFPGDDLYRGFNDWYRNPKKDGRTITRDGNILKIEDRFIPTNMPQLGELSFQYEFDLSKGGSPIYFRHENLTAELEEVGKWTYEDINGIWLPLTFSYHNQTGGKSHPMKKTEDLITFEKNIINEPIDPCEFTIEKLGVIKGTLITDRVAGTSYRYNK